MIKFISKQLPLALLAAGLLSACSMAPQYLRPDAPVATSYPGQPGTQAGQQAADIGWRSFFQDPQLQALIAAALDHNRDLRSAALRIDEARAQYNIQSADRLPTLNGNASGSRSRSPADLSSGGSVSNNNRYDVGFSLASFELDFFGRVRSLNDAALAQYLATEEARLSVQISLVAEVAKAALAERAFAEQLALAHNTLDGRDNAYRLEQKRFEVGAASTFDLRQNETLLESARVAVATLARQRAQAANALTLLVGKPVAGLPAAQALAAPAIVSAVPAGLPSDLLARRPDIRALEQKLKAANANIGAARAAFFPRIALTAGIGSASSSLSGLFEAGSGAWSFAPQLTLPIFDAGRNRSNLSLAQVRKDLAIVDYEKAIQSAFREVADTLSARAFLDTQVNAQAAVQQAQAERLKLSVLRQENGIASALDVLDAQRELFSAEQSLVQAQLLRLNNAIDLYRALGGGWQEGSSAAN